ncbi:ABC transporter permease [Desulforhopalus sp. IMCC35007]|uniref:ABC transporter permease n=1 Tax=Desulforhopalus sp. IMCC35007 TaxID=2569543 RepID=UPI0010AEA5CB|nr:ABC transporter permease [Desulforhopalus sp. IMCC35007]TKB06946.1 ABC transporter permease [Desulforhopalus sp. IMCC35007]
MKIVRPLLLVVSFLICWHLLVQLTKVPHYILPGPVAVYLAFIQNWSVLLGHMGVTLTEIVLGLLLGTILGCLCALTMILSPLLKRWLLPVLVMSQAIPVFALAPILVLWLGYGIASKVAMAVLIIFFPVTSSFYHGMQRTETDLLELARIMGGGHASILRFIVIPNALPAFGGGLRVAAAVAPIGAIIGEWVGASKGLGFYMLHANARMQVDRMFAALILLAVVSVGLYYLVDFLLLKIIYWEKPRELYHE